MKSRGLAIDLDGHHQVSNDYQLEEDNSCFHNDQEESQAMISLEGS